ncbi:expressed unknown protein [Seminavis robusta]|uniref:Transmembrane protein n=1 Tax=Seminavis robusta TaxID=568900 RepID=A0A9N8HQR0_9STRA|nr:expressed unknown protein [Seminavis robusta]|eukprot:Sro1223_g253860.1 n/a (380) ;mRNA; f:5886-7199
MTESATSMMTNGGVKQTPVSLAEPPKSTSWKPDKKSILDKLASSREERTFFIPHIHKILGFSCLASFVYRYAHIGPTDGNFGPNFGTLVFIIHHLSLHASSFIFRLPKVRRLQGGYRIWPEFRWHALGFTSRSLAFILLMWQEQMNGIPPNSTRCYQEMDLVIVLATCAFADLGSYIERENQTQTIRGTKVSDPFEHWFASEMQIYLTALCVVGYRRYTLHLLAISVIQCNAFLMTLNRKNVAPQGVLVGIYGFMLVGGFAVISYDDSFSHRTGVGGTVGGIAAILRMGPLRVNKYILWTALWCVWYYVRMNRILPYYNTMFWLKGMVITKILSTFLGLIKRSRAPRESRSSLVAFLVFATHAALFAWLYWMNFVRSRR